MMVYEEDVSSKAWADQVSGAPMKLLILRPHLTRHQIDLPIVPENLLSDPYSWDTFAHIAREQEYYISEVSSHSDKFHFEGDTYFPVTLCSAWVSRIYR